MLDIHKYLARKRSMMRNNLRKRMAERIIDQILVSPSLRMRINHDRVAEIASR
jgi:hypothetical protein